MVKAATRKQLEDLLYLKERGYEVPDGLVKLVQEAEWKRRGVLQVFKCPYCKDMEPIESEVKVKEYYCPKGHKLKVIFSQ